MALIGRGVRLGINVEVVEGVWVGNGLEGRLGVTVAVGKGDAQAFSRVKSAANKIATSFREELGAKRVFTPTF